MKRFWLITFILLMLFALGACSTQMPFNGEVEFHDMGITIPSDFIRVSMQSTDTTWFFTKGKQEQTIILARDELQGEISKILDDYVGYMTESGAKSQRTKFQDLDAVHTTYTREGVYCQELLIAYENATYAVALRGGTEEAFQALLDTLRLG